jgi:hypothetical protein
MGVSKGSPKWCPQWGSPKREHPNRFPQGSPRRRVLQRRSPSWIRCGVVQESHTRGSPGWTSVGFTRVSSRGPRGMTQVVPQDWSTKGGSRRAVVEWGSQGGPKMFPHLGRPGCSRWGSPTKCHQGGSQGGPTSGFPQRGSPKGRPPGVSTTAGHSGKFPQMGTSRRVPLVGFQKGVPQSPQGVPSRGVVMFQCGGIGSGCLCVGYGVAVLYRLWWNGWCWCGGIQSTVVCLGLFPLLSSLVYSCGELIIFRCSTIMFLVTGMSLYVRTGCEVNHKSAWILFGGSLHYFLCSPWYYRARNVVRISCAGLAITVQCVTFMASV